MVKIQIGYYLHSRTIETFSCSHAAKHLGSVIYFKNHSQIHSGYSRFVKWIHNEAREDKLLFTVLFFVNTYHTVTVLSVAENVKNVYRHLVTLNFRVTWAFQLLKEFLNCQESYSKHIVPSKHSQKSVMHLSQTTWQLPGPSASRRHFSVLCGLNSRSLQSASCWPAFTQCFQHCNPKYQA